MPTRKRLYGNSFSRKSKRRKSKRNYRTYRLKGGAGSVGPEIQETESIPYSIRPENTTKSQSSEGNQVGMSNEEKAKARKNAMARIMSRSPEEKAKARKNAGLVGTERRV